MSAIKVRPIRTRRERRIFLTFPWRVYRDDPLWVPPWLSERAKMVDPERGVFFQRGEAEFFVAWRDGQPVGTICAADDPMTNDGDQKRDCTFGFFECVDDDDVARALFDSARDWAQERGMRALYGPFNLDYEDGYGILVEGYDRPPVLFCGHTPRYYKRIFEELGFEKARGDVLAFAFDLDQDSRDLQRLSRLAGRVRQRGHLVLREGDLAHWDDEIDRVHVLLKRALAHLDGQIGWRREMLHELLSPFRDIVDPELILFVDADGETIGWFPGIANLYEPLQKANGLRYPWDYLKMWWHMRRQPDCLSVKSVLVLPEYWDTGAALLLFDEMIKRARKKGYKWLDLSLTAEDNPYTPVLAERMGCTLYKRYRVYRLRFD